MAKIVDWFVRSLVVVAFLALIFEPQKWGTPGAFICLTVVGIWSLRFPQGVLGWAKTAHPSIQADDRSLWWVPRLIGSFFVIFAALVALMTFAR